MAKPVLAVVDGHSLVHRAFHALPPTMTSADGRPTNAAFGFTAMLIKMVQDLAPDGVIVAFDKGKAKFRSDVLERYKIHRPPMPDDLRVQFPIVREILESLSVPIVELEGWEGDDILGTLAAKGREAGMRVLLVTGDRDALQLVDEDVSVVSTRRGVTDIFVYTPEAVKERYGVTPEQVTDYLGLKGDASDNIPGVPGVGEKTAAKLIAEYGSLDAVLCAAAGIKGKLGENLREHAEDARASRVVATIRCDVPVDVDVTDVRWGGFDPEKVLETFNRFQFRSLVGRVLESVESGDVVLSVAEEDTWPVVNGREADERLAKHLAETPETVLGVGVDDGSSESLFGGGMEVAVAVPGAVLRPSDGEAALRECLASGRVACADAKALLAAAAVDECDAERVFDCALAGYLLESNRAAYDLQGLYGTYVGKRLAERSGDGERAVADAEAAARLSPVLEEALRSDGSEECFRTIEMPLVPVLVRMERVGVGIDRGVLSDMSGDMGGRISALRSEIQELAGVEFNVDSPKQLAEVLFERMGLPSSKRTKTGYSTDSSVLQALGPDCAIAQRILQYRELTKLNSTYVEALPRLIAEDGRLHTTFNQTVAATGRLSSSSPNLQNIPVRTELGRHIREAFVPAEAGDLMVSADYSQIELRILAHLSGDQGLIDAFTSGADFHAATAARVFGVPIEAVTSQQRAKAKAVNFGIVYGQSAHGLAESIGVPHAEAQATIDRYFAAYPGVREFLDRTVADAHRDGFAVTMFGRRRRIPELRSSNYNLRSFGERTAMNHPMQGTAADIIKLAMIEVDRRLRESGLRGRMVLQVHDELVFESPSSEVETLSALAVDAMSGVASLAVPLEVNVSSGTNWAAAK